MEMPPNYYFLKSKKTAIKQVQITKNKPQKRPPPHPPQKTTQNPTRSKEIKNLSVLLLIKTRTDQAP